VKHRASRFDGGGAAASRRLVITSKGTTMSARLASCLLLLTILSMVATSAQAPATEWPTQDGAYIIKNFRFGSGESLPELKLHYLTLGKPHKDAQGHTDNAVLLLHGTGGSAHSLLNPVFANVLFGPGQPLDITKFFIIFPDDIGHGQSSKPSDGLHMRFPQYDYDDMVTSQHTMLLEGLHVDHLRLILGTSMGCMQSFIWGETYPQFADALAPFACLPVELAGRNRMWRYMAMQTIKNDPAWNNGEYTTEPVEGLRGANDLIILAGSSPLQMQKNFPTRAQAETYIDRVVAAADASTDANDFLYYVNASRNYNPAPKLATITAPVLWINSADDFINPPELGIAERMVTQMSRAKFILLPISDATRGHGTHTQAAIWKQYLIDFLAKTERK
jgi:homoserine O-acetyltransferase